jgi:hypothetical protein
MRLRNVLLGVAGVLALGVVALVVAVATLDFGRFREPLAAQVARATGRALVFEGEVSLRLFPRPSLSVRDVALANAPWGTRPHMLRIGRLEAELELRPLLFDRALHVTRFVAADVDVLLETDASGQRNWEMSAGRDGAAGLPVPADAGAPVDPGAFLRIDSLNLSNVALTWRDARSAEEPRSVLLRRLDVTTRPDGRLSLAGEAIHREQPIGFAGDVDLPTGFLAPGGPFVGQLGLTMPGAVANLVGGLADARAGRGLDLTLSAQAEPVNALDELLGLALPPGRLDLAARLEGDLGGEMRAGELRLRLGRSDLAGAASLDLSGPRPVLGAELESTRLDLAELLAARPGTPQSSDNPAAPPAADTPGETRLFPAEPFDLSPLRLLDADLSLRVATLATASVALEQVTLRLVLRDGDLAVRPYGFLLAGSHVAGDARLNASTSPPTLVLDLAAQQIDIGRLLAEAIAPAELAAKGDLVLALRGAGDSPRALAASMAGTASLVVGQGRLKGDYIESLGLGALRAAVPQLQRLAESRLNCAIARFDIAGGVATARLIGADAGDLSLVGTGTVNLGTETLALDLAPRMKIAAGGISGGVVVPVQVRGTLLDPTVSVLGGRGQRGNPLAGLRGLVLDPGASRTNPCGGLGDAHPAAPAPAPAPRPAIPGLPDVLRLLPR